ncbi:prepilin-type N-terminal cleavage/methylation domain-containing protein [Priestia filamentosa]|uniref:prepilin-type N-terminal cleavage/methylation domain-containing protein n=1 Tax=Priestia filamentosa TaxID=1402861 RepID=UPI0005890D1F
MVNKFKNMFKNQKGFTLVEILVVIVIIGILFTVIIPRIDFAGDRARQSGVKTDFKAFQTAAEGYFRETAGNGLTFDGLNTYLDAPLKTDSTAAIDATGVTAKSKKKDPWGVEYSIIAKKASNTSAQIIFTANGKTGKTGTADDYDFISASYYQKGTIESCTDGFNGSQDIELTSIEGADGNALTTCGADIS